MEQDVTNDKLDMGEEVENTGGGKGAGTVADGGKGGKTEVFTDTLGNKPKRKWSRGITEGKMERG